MEANASKSAVLHILLIIGLLIEIGDSHVDTLASFPQTTPSQSSFPKTSPILDKTPLSKTPPSSGSNPFPFSFPFPFPFSFPFPFPFPGSPSSGGNPFPFSFPFPFPFSFPGTPPSSKDNPFPFPFPFPFSFPFPFPGTPSSKDNPFRFPFPFPRIPPSSKANPNPFPFSFPLTPFPAGYLFSFPFPGTPFSGGNPFPFPLPFLPPGSPYPFGPVTREAKVCLDRLHNIFISPKHHQDLDGTHLLCSTIRELKPKCWPILFPYAPLPPSLLAKCGAPAPAPINSPNPANN